MSLVEWFANKLHEFQGAALEFVTDKSKKERSLLEDSVEMVGWWRYPFFEIHHDERMT